MRKQNAWEVSWRTSKGEQPIRDLPCDGSRRRRIALRIAIRQHDGQEPGVANETHGLEGPALGTAQFEPVQSEQNRLLRTGRCVPKNSI